MLSFEIQFAEEPRALFWCLHKVAITHATGVLTISQSSSAAEEVKKEIIFENGQIVSCLTNRQQENLANFLVKTQRVSREDMTKALESLKSLSNKSDRASLPGVLIQLQILDPSALMESLKQHLIFKVFNWLSVARGKASFQSVENLPEKVKSLEEGRMEEDFLGMLWREGQNFLDEDYCRSRFAQKQSHEISLRGEIPFPVPPQTLRLWKDLSVEPRRVSDLQGEALKLAALALEFEQVHWGSSEGGRLKAELLEMQSCLKKKNFFEILRVEEGCSSAQLKKAYFDLVKRYHPDRLPVDVGAEVKSLSEEVFAAINEAHSTLSDQEKRGEYEAELALQRAGGRKAIEKRLSAEMKFEEGLLHFRHRSWNRALECFEEVKEVMEGDTEFDAYYVFAEALVDMERKLSQKDKLVSGVKRLDACIQKDPQNAHFFYFKGYLLKLADQAEHALKAFDQALEINPQLNEAASEARVLRSRLSKDKKASGWFKKG